MTDGLSDEAASLLSGERLVAHLATCEDGRPHVAPVWYRCVDDAIEIVTTGRKLERLRTNPRVALSIERGEESRPDWTVTVLGTATVIDDEDASQAANRRMNRKYGVSEGMWEEENVLVRVRVGSASVRTY